MRDGLALRPGGNGGASCSGAARARALSANAPTPARRPSAARP
eukprot:CAMPEP_0198613524 /NCGR_PEP_ID=MMETSP1462-20131121/158436_1 /TAXON_ID=1333877 /ORGANISM="Brandtodinium nutriculum, Strain RCC3387" /LENGTH=42 /DNA_ID= /DNA_START= /DNA_END= /DNA_ORIENTATION=